MISLNLADVRPVQFVMKVYVRCNHDPLALAFCPLVEDKGFPHLLLVYIVGGSNQGFPYHRVFLDDGVHLGADERSHIIISGQGMDAVEASLGSHIKFLQYGAGRKANLGTFHDAELR